MLPEAARLGSCLPEARNRVRGFHLEEEGGAARARLETEAEEGIWDCPCAPLVSAAASWPADLLAGCAAAKQPKSNCYQLLC